MFQDNKKKCSLEVQCMLASLTLKLDSWHSSTRLQRSIYMYFGVSGAFEAVGDVGGF